MKNKHIKWIWNLWKGHKFFVLWLVFLTLLSASVSVAYPLVFKELLDTLKEILKYPDKFPEPSTEINRLIWLVIGIGLVKLFASLYPGFRAQMNLIFEYVLRKKYFSFLLDKDYKFFNKYRSGDLVTRLTDDISDYPKISWFLCSGIFRAFNSFAIVFFCIVSMFFLNWRLSLLSLIPVPIMGLIFYLVQEKLYTTFKNNQEAISGINNQLEMSFSGSRIIKAFVCENKYKRFFQKALNKRYDTEVEVVKINTFMHLIYEYIGQFAQIGIIIFGGYMVVKGTVTIGTFYAFYSYLAMLVYPILDLPNLFVSGKQAFVNIDRLEEIKDFPTIEEREYKMEKHIIKNIEKIEFRNVSFSYEDHGKEVIRELNFVLKRREKLLILGYVGSGKSTILGLIVGIYKPLKGTILVNDIPIEDIDLIDLRKKIGFVPQESSLFSGSIRDNVVFGHEEFNKKMYDVSLQISQLQNEIESFLDKHDTVVGQRGLSLSGGQKQRLAIARALIKEPQLLILDDITASLDAKNEEKLWNALNSTFEDCTYIVVSNRISTVRYVDNILFLDSGIAVGNGTHDDLILENETYRNFIDEHVR